MGSYSPDSSTTGGAQTGFTSPTFTNVDDTPPAVNAKQKTVSAVSGTGSASANSISKPFTSTFFKPAVVKQLPAPNPLTGARPSIPSNQYKLIIRKGTEVASGVPATIVARLTVDVPAGADSYSPDDVRALASYLVGLLTEESADFGDTLVSGVL